MKFLVLSCVVITVLAEPPRFRSSRLRFQRQELAPTTDSPAEPTTQASGPYPASGWKPDGQPFTLPTENGPAPDNTYGAPVTSYGTPDNAYGPPANTYGAPGTGDADTASPTDDQAAAEDSVVDLLKNPGTYYIQLSDGSLQKVEVTPQSDAQNKPARLQVRRPAQVVLFRSRL